MPNLSPAFVDIETSDPRGSLERAMAGDFDAYGDVYRAYSTRLLRHAMALCRNTALAEELAQDRLVEAWKYLRRYNGRCEFFTWLCAILLNRYRKHFRRQRPLPISSLRDHDEFADAIANLKDHGSSPYEAADLAEQTTLVRRCIESLPVKHQQVIYLRFYVDDSLEECGQRWDVRWGRLSPGCLRSRQAARDECHERAIYKS